MRMYMYMCMCRVLLTTRNRRWFWKIEFNQCQRNLGSKLRAYVSRPFDIDSDRILGWLLISLIFIDWNDVCLQTGRFMRASSCKFGMRIFCWVFIAFPSCAWDRISFSLRKVFLHRHSVRRSLRDVSSTVIRLSLASCYKRILVCIEA